LDAVAALVGRRRIELHLRGTEMVERGLHAGLIGRGAAGHETGGENDEERQEREETTSSHTCLPFFRIRYATAHETQVVSRVSLPPRFRGAERRSAGCAAR